MDLLPEHFDSTFLFADFFFKKTIMLLCFINYLMQKNVPIKTKVLDDLKIMFE